MPQLSWKEVQDNALAFSRRWATAASEHADKQTFWNEFFAVFGRERRTVASFEVAVRNLHGAYNYIDLLWRGVLLVEHKTRGKSLAAAESQAFAYIEDLARENRFDEIPRFVIVSDFARVALYDLEPEEQADLPLFAGRRYTCIDFALGEFHKSQIVRRFAFIKGERTVRLREEDPANQKAYDRMCELHDELEANGFKDEPLERCLVRLLFCLFADDTGVFDPDTFETFILTRTREDGSDLGLWLNKLFAVLNTREADWSAADREIFAGFRYINGDLFKDTLPFPDFNRSTRKALLDAAAFQWARVSPAVFGSLFQGIMKKGERRQRGAHYTSERDILKVVHSLFLEFLEAELIGISSDTSTRRAARLKDYLAKLRSLRFLDPACGCGNFLVISYRELRRLELRALRELHADGAQAEALGLLVRVDVDQFYGIEIDRWPAEIARAAMWLMDHQMNQEVTEAFARNFARLPLQTSPHIVTDNALRIDWKDVLDPKECSYVLGNPPFVGHHYQSPEQKADQQKVLRHIEARGILDFVCNWYVKAAEYIQGTRIPVAFVSTNSITQGEQAGILWSELFGRYNLKIHFAHRTFPWASAARGAAHVHVVIIGFGAFDVPKKQIYEADPQSGRDLVHEVTNIGPLLTAGADLAVVPRSEPLCDVPKMSWGNKPTDGGHLILSPAEREELLAHEPAAAPFVRPYMGGFDFINGEQRYCLWLVGADPATVRKLPRILQRVEAVREFRLASKAASTRKYADQSTLFRQIAQPDSEYLAVPEVSSANRRYIPMAFISREVICSNTVQFIPQATLWLFGTLISTIHMAWVRSVCGRLKSDYRYSNTLVYNNFPWPEAVDDKRRAAVETAARAVLEARQPFLPPAGTSTLADLYDPLTMPAALTKAHAELDRAVDRCYRDTPFKSDRERVEHLFALYEKLTAPLLPATGKKKRDKKIVPSATGATELKDIPFSPAVLISETQPGTKVSRALGKHGLAGLPVWFRKALAELEKGNNTSGTAQLADEVERQLDTGNLKSLDVDLGKIAAAADRSPVTALITLLNFTLSAKSDLPSRAALREAAHRRACAIGKDADALLKRL